MMKKKVKRILLKEIPFFVGIPAILWQIIFLYLPLFFIVALSFVSSFSSVRSFGFTFSNYAPFFESMYWKVVGYSVLIALLNTVLCVVCAFPVAYFLAFRAKRFKSFFLFLLIVPFWVNFLLHIYAWFFMLEHGGFINSFLLWIGCIEKPLQLLNTQFAVSLGMLYCYLPFMALPVYSALDRFDRKLIEASLDLGASHWKTFLQVTLPVTFPGWQSGLLLVFIPSCAEFAVPVLLGGDKQLFLGNVISHYVLGDKTLPLGAAFTILSSTALVGMIFLLYRISKRLIR